jgi:hypothetical protein
MTSIGEYNTRFEISKTESKMCYMLKKVQIVAYTLKMSHETFRIM